MLEGMAKPMPEPPATMAVAMPTISPCMLTSGPPELPGLMAASVCKKSSKGPWPIWRAFALMMPAVTVAWSPKGEPTAITQSPTWTLSESPSRAKGNLPLPSSRRSTARSVFLSMPTTFALCLLPSSVMTSISRGPLHDVGVGEGDAGGVHDDARAQAALGDPLGRFAEEAPEELLTEELLERRAAHASRPG